MQNNPNRIRIRRPTGEALRLPWPSWRIIRLIGEGSFGVVYEACKVGGAFDERCAIKHIPIPKSARDVSEGFRQGLYTTDAGAKAYYTAAKDSIVQEIQLMQRFSGHSHIVNYFDYEIVERKDMPGYDVFIRMELLKSLDEYMAGIDMAHLQETVIALGVDLCDALDTLHRAKVIHRDIKLDNVLHGITGFKLGDFSVAKSLEVTGSVTLAGTMGYMSPEIYLHRKDVSFTSDLYSLAIMLYRLLNGNRMPFLPGDPAVVIDNNLATEAFERRMQGEPLPAIPGVSSGLMHVIIKAGSFLPQARYPSARDMRNALEGRPQAALRGGAEAAQVGMPPSYGSHQVPPQVSPGAVQRSMRPAAAMVEGSHRESGSREVVAPKGHRRGRTALILALVAVLAAAAAFLALHFMNNGKQQEPTVGWLPVANVATGQPTAISTVALTTTPTAVPTATPIIVTIRNDRAAAAIRQAAGIADDQPITADAMATLTSLELTGMELEDISFLTYAKNLAYLDLGHEVNAATLDDADYATNCIKDVTPLRKLTKLGYLNLDYNQINDISPLKDLTSLTSLDLDHNQLSDISPLQDLTSLAELSLGSAQINDISPLQSLTNLTTLDLSNTSISDISPLQGLINLTELDLSYNQIRDISPLQNLSALAGLYLWGNQIRDFSPLKSLTNLRVLALYCDQSSDISPLQGLTNLHTLTLYGNSIRNISSLRDLTSLTSLKLNSSRIRNISPLQSLTNLTMLTLSNTQVSELSPLQNLTGLTELHLNNNQISNITPLQGLTSLTKLDLNGNLLSNISTLQGLTNLVSLDLGDNRLSNISAVQSLSSLATLNLGDNRISNITPLQGLAGLAQLNLNSNRLSDISVLQSLTSLISLDLGNNQIRDVTPLQGLTNLTTLELSSNQIRDLMPLRSLTQLVEIKYDDNPIGD